MDCQLQDSEQAQAALTDFEQSNKVGVWSYLDKQTIINEMRSRISDPFQVNQGGQPFCGPASILFELVRKQPLRYVQICQNLFETGSFVAQNRTIKASDKLRNSQGKLYLSQADWMVLATWRESENLIFPVEPDAPEIIRNLGGMTKSWEMKGWVKEVLAYREFNYIHTYLYGEFEALQAAAQIIADGGVAFALITAEGLLGNQKPFLPYPNHWITILGNISLPAATSGKAGNITFDLYSWGKKMHVDIDRGSLESYLWGLVLGKP